MHIGARQWIFFILLATVPLAAYFYVFEPRNSEISQIQDKLRVKQARLTRLAEMERTISDLGSMIDQGRDAIDQLELKLPSKQHVDVILAQVWTIASRNGLEPQSFKTQAERQVGSSDYREAPHRIEIEGSFDGFYQFLLELEALPRITRVHSLSIRHSGGPLGPRSADRDTGLINADFILSIYYEG
ncbi:MAG: type 4a pilus biogenesis protein PilO [Phycisphaerales bacterium]|jgi:type IV pilus assembly protein PilO|nr:type 4a pilus biogenesis protein PilO [Phycisphaerales bacterium]